MINIYSASPAETLKKARALGLDNCLYAIGPNNIGIIECAMHYIAKFEKSLGVEGAFRRYLHDLSGRRYDFIIGHLQSHPTYWDGVTGWRYCKRGIAVVRTNNELLHT